MKIRPEHRGIAFPTSADDDFPGIYVITDLNDEVVKIGRSMRGIFLRMLEQHDRFPPDQYRFYVIERTTCGSEAQREREWELQRLYGVRDNFREFTKEDVKKAVKTNRRNGTGLYDEEVRKKGAKRAAELGVGIHSQEAQKKSVETQRREKNGIFDEEVRKKSAATRRKLYGKSVIGTSIIDGSTLTFDAKKDVRHSGFCPSHVSKCCNGKRKQHKGYTWRWTEK